MYFSKEIACLPLCAAEETFEWIALRTYEFRRTLFSTFKIIIDTFYCLFNDGVR